MVREPFIFFIIIPSSILHFDSDSASSLIIALVFGMSEDSDPVQEQNEE